MRFRLPVTKSMSLSTNLKEILWFELGFVRCARVKIWKFSESLFMNFRGFLISVLTGGSALYIPLDVEFHGASFRFKKPSWQITRCEDANTFVYLCTGICSIPLHGRFPREFMEFFRDFFLPGTADRRYGFASWNQCIRSRRRSERSLIQSIRRNGSALYDDVGLFARYFIQSCP